jgi:hypothetical protein
MSAAIYLVSALVLRVTSGYAFPLLPVAAWIAGVTLVFVAAAWSTRGKTLPVVVTMLAFMYAWTTVVERLTAVELPDGFDWPPRLWPALFDFPRSDYAWLTLVAVAAFAVAIAGVARQRRGDAWVDVASAPRDGFWDRLVNLFAFSCPTSSPTRAQVWLDLKANGLPVLTIGVTLAIMILLVSAVANPIDAAINADPDVSCPIGECFYARAAPPLLAPFSLFVMLCLGGNAFGIRRTQGRTHIAFEATHAHGTAQLAALKVLVKSACVLAAVVVIGVSGWIAARLLGDAVFIQMWGAPLSSQLSALTDRIASLTPYQQLALAVVAAVGLVVWVAALAVFDAVLIRYCRRVTFAAAALLLGGLALALLAGAESRRILSSSVFDAIVAAALWIVFAVTVCTAVYLFWTGFAERVLTIGYTGGAVAMSAAFAAAWVTVLHMAGVELAGMSALDAVSILSPALLPLLVGVLAPWSLSRLRHT